MATTSKKQSSTKKTSSSSVHQYVSTTPTNVPGQYNTKTVTTSTLNKGIPDAYKAKTVKAETYKGPKYKADTYTSNYTPTEYTDAYNPGQYQSKYMPQIEQRLNDVTNWKYDPLQDASYQALAAVYGAQGNLAAKNSLADAAALNGGYGTSNAVSAAQQARNQYNQQLASLVPDLEQAAYNRATNGLNALMDMDNTLYGRFSDDEQRALAAKQFGLDVAGYNEGNRQFAEQNAQNVWSMNRDDQYKAVQNALDIFNTNTANKQWAQNFNQGERQFGYNSRWDRYNAKNANRQWANTFNQGERQFGYNAAMDRAQLLNDYYKWAQDYNSGLYEWNLAQAQKAASGSGGGRGGRSSGGGGGYSGGGSASTTTDTNAMPITAEDFEKLKNKKTGTAVGSSGGTGVHINKKLQMTK